MHLYTYYRSSAAYRVRIALNLKGLKPEETYVHLRKKEQRTADYMAKNPQGLVPTLVDGDVTLSQSLAILEYLNEVHPQPPLLPTDPAGRGRVRQLAQIVACDIHPLDNLKVLNYLSEELGVDEDARTRWYRHWVDEGLSAMERLLAGQPETGDFCHGPHPTVADICLVPQIYNARRFDVDLTAYPTVMRINDNCLSMETFSQAAPDVQPDAE